MPYILLSLLILLSACSDFQAHVDVKDGQKELKADFQGDQKND